MVSILSVSILLGGHFVEYVTRSLLFGPQGIGNRVFTWLENASIKKKAGVESYLHTLHTLIFG